MNQDIIQHYFKTGIAKGFSKEYIKEMLLQKGYPENEVNLGYHSIIFAQPSPNSSKKTKIKKEQKSQVNIADLQTKPSLSQSPQVHTKKRFSFPKPPSFSLPKFSFPKVNFSKLKKLSLTFLLPKTPLQAKKIPPAQPPPPQPPPNRTPLSYGFGDVPSSKFPKTFMISLFIALFLVGGFFALQNVSFTGFAVKEVSTEQQLEEIAVLQEKIEEGKQDLEHGIGKLKQKDLTIEEKNKIIEGQVQKLETLQEYIEEEQDKVRELLWDLLQTLLKRGEAD